MLRFIRLLLAGLILVAAPAFADMRPLLVKGQTLYVPVYAFIWHGDMKAGSPEKTPLSTLVSIRNTDPTGTLRVVSARYYDTAGKLIKDYVPQAITVPALGTHELYVERRDVAGGSGANFLIEWQSTVALNAPVVEAVHAEILGHKTVVFITEGREVDVRK